MERARQHEGAPARVPTGCADVRDTYPGTRDARVTRVAEGAAHRSTESASGTFRPTQDCGDS